MRALRVVLLLVLGLMAMPAARGGPFTQDPCEGTVTGPEVFVRIGSNVLENLLFHDGALWVSDASANRVLRLNPDGTVTGGLDAVPAPGGLAAGPDGLIYAGWQNGAVTAVLRAGASKVVRFNPADPNGTLEVYAEGFHMPNGMTFGPGDDLYISNDFDRGLIRIPRDDPSGWHELAPVWGTNGLVVDPAGQNLYAAVTFDQRSPIERVPLNDPNAHETFVQLSFGAVSLEPGVHLDGDPSAPLLGVKGLDDMTRDEDGILYVVANGTGELIRVDADASACLVASGFQNPSSVRIAPPGGAFDTSGEAFTLYVTEFSGAIRTVGYTPAGG